MSGKATMKTLRKVCGRALHSACLILCVSALAACAGQHYADTQAGTLTGTLTVEWYKPNLFRYRPDSSSPLKFKRHDGTVIEPQDMYTDGGSIPRPFWAFRNYSPWGYGPAFIVHDWLFHMQNCMLPGHESFTLQKAADVMSEVMKTLMETPGFDYGSKSSVYLMFEAVQSPPAAAAWDHGACETPSEFLITKEPDATFVISAGP
jgi:hypothetical protein